MPCFILLSSYLNPCYGLAETILNSDPTWRPGEGCCPEVALSTLILGTVAPQQTSLGLLTWGSPGGLEGILSAQEGLRPIGIFWGGGTAGTGTPLSGVTANRTHHRAKGNQETEIDPTRLQEGIYPHSCLRMGPCQLPPLRPQKQTPLLRFYPEEGTLHSHLPPLNLTLCLTPASQGPSLLGAQHPTLATDPALLNVGYHSSC